MSCKINLAELSPEDRNETILYITHDIIIYRKMNRIVLGSCDGTILSDARTPVDFEKYEFLDLDDAVLFLFNGMDLLLMDKLGAVPEQYTLDLVKLGQCVTKLYHSNDPNRVIFGTRKGDRIQFINYDFMTKQRVAQTASWSVSKVTNIHVDNMVLYAVLDESIIVVCNMETGETLWTRFETAQIGKGLAIQNGHLVYCCQGVLKKVQDDEVSTIRIPLLVPFSIEHYDDRRIYFTSNIGKNVCSYYSVGDRLEWQIYGHRIVQESITAQDINGNDLLLLRTNDYIAIINLSMAQAENGLRTPNTYRLRKTTDHVLIQKTTGSTTLIPGVFQDGLDN